DVLWLARGQTDEDETDPTRAGQRRQRENAQFYSGSTERRGSTGVVAKSACGGDTSGDFYRSAAAQLVALCRQPAAAVLLPLTAEILIAIRPAVSGPCSD